MEGGRALAVPIKFGQVLKVRQTTNLKPGTLIWDSYVTDQSWFHAVFDINKLEIAETDNIKIAENLLRILSAAGRLNDSLFSKDIAFSAESHMNFNINWGLGSSSSLISNIAYWADIDPYELHFRVFRGSGYDIACAREDKALLYQIKDLKPIISTTNFLPEFREHLYFIYTGKKQDSNKSINDFKSSKRFSYHDINRISEISVLMAGSKTLQDFESLIAEHEEIMSVILKTKPLKKQSFNDFEGQIKSLGAWGGDFMLVTWKGNRMQLEQYFIDKKNLNTIFSFKEIVKYA